MWCKRCTWQGHVRWMVEALSDQSPTAAAWLLSKAVTQTPCGQWAATCIRVAYAYQFDAYTYISVLVCMYKRYPREYGFKNEYTHTCSCRQGNEHPWQVHAVVGDGSSLNFSTQLSGRCVRLLRCQGVEHMALLVTYSSNSMRKEGRLAT